MSDCTKRYVRKDAKDEQLAQTILRFLRANAGSRFNEPHIAQRMKVSVAAARRALRLLASNGDVIIARALGTMHVYFAASAQAIESPRIVGKGELKGWESGIRRLSELRMAPRGAGWRL
jgi:hypothetical protein